MQLLMCLLVLKCHCGCTSAIQLELVLPSHVMHKEFRALQASWVHNILVFSDYFWWDMISGINSWGCQHWLCHMSHWLYTRYERSYVRDVGWGSPAGTLVGPDDKPVLKNVDLRWRRNSKHLCHSCCRTRIAKPCRGSSWAEPKERQCHQWAVWLHWSCPGRILRIF